MIVSIEARLSEQYALEAGMLWALRDAAARDPLYDLVGLSEIDQRIEAHLDGLRLAGDAGWRTCKAALDEAEAGDVFAAAAVATDRQDLPAIAHVLDRAGGSPELSRGLVSALGWVSWGRVLPILPGLLNGRCPPELHYLGIAACAGHRQDPGPPLGYAVLSPDPRLKARSLRAAGELRRADLLPEVRLALQDPDSECRFWAAWASALLGEPAAASSLWAFALEGGPHAARACAMAMRRMAPATGRARLHELGGDPVSARVALVGAAALGDPVLVPWIVEHMQVPELARPAGAALRLITGLDLAEERLHGARPPGFEAGPNDDPRDENVAMDPDESLPWPDAAAVSQWWGRKAGDFKRETRYLLGRELSIEWLEQVLRRGHQPARAAAAVELCLQQPARRLFEVRAPGGRQQRELGARNG